MASYLAVGDSGRILCAGSNCSGAQKSNVGVQLRGVSRSSFFLRKKLPLRLAVGENGTVLRMGSGGTWVKLDSDTSKHLNAVSVVPGKAVAWAVGDDG